MDFDTKNPNLGYPSQIFFVCKNSILKETFNVKKNFWEFVILRILCLNVQINGKFGRVFKQKWTFLNSVSEVRIGDFLVTKCENVSFLTSN